MNDEKQALLEYLKRKAGGSLTLTPKELALEIRVSEKQQSKLRSLNRFPIPHRDIGRSVVYSIHAVADFLLTGERKEMPPEAISEDVQAPTPSRKPRTGVQDLSQILLLNNFATTLQEQVDSLTRLQDFISKRAQATEMNDGLERTLPDTKPAKKYKQPV